MKTWMLGVMALALALGGCAGFVCKSDMGKYIDAQAVRAIADMRAAEGGTMDANAALESVRQNAEASGLYAAEKTTNPFAYFFGPHTILANTKIADDLDRNAVLCAEGLTRATTRPAQEGSRVVLKTCPLVIDAKHFKDKTVNE